MDFCLEVPRFLFYSQDVFYSTLTAESSFLCKKTFLLVLTRYCCSINATLNRHFVSWIHCKRLHLNYELLMNYGITECDDTWLEIKHQFKRDYVHCWCILFFFVVNCNRFFFLVWLSTDFIFIYEQLSTLKIFHFRRNYVKWIRLSEFGRLWKMARDDD